MTPAIEVTNASLAYRLVHQRASSVHELAVSLPRSHRRPKAEMLWAVRGVSFNVGRGEILGIVGANGAGKSTLMKLMARVLPPAGGRVVVRGRTAPLIELGAGFHPEMTGYDNLVLYGTILGHSPAVLRRRAHEIAEWAGLVDFLDVPVRSYSSGMLARLGFSVASFGEPDVLLVDEALSVGDEEFRRRCHTRMVGLVDKGASVVLVSHELPLISKLAHRVAWIDHGRLVQLGDPAEAVASYVESERGSAPIERSGPHELVEDR